MVLHNFSYSFGGKNLSDMASRMDYGGTNVSSMTDVNMATIWSTFAAAGRNSVDSAFVYLGVGSGATTVTYEDTGLANPITSLTVLSASQVTASGKIIKYIDTTFRNDTASPITVRELVFGFNLTSNSKRCGFVIARKVLSHPVTINPEETYSISYSIVLKQ